MPRKSAQTLAQQRNDIKRRYRRGRKTERKITSEESLNAFDKEVKRTVACYLKAQDFSNGYIGEALGLGKGVVKAWFIEPEMQERVAAIQLDFVDGAVKLLKSYAIEFVEMLAEIARTTKDDKLAIQAITEGLDRMGIAKVNKSQSKVVTEDYSEVDITDKTGLMEYLKDAPPEVRAKAAEHMQDLEALMTERKP